MFRTLDKRNIGFVQEKKERFFFSRNQERKGLTREEPKTSLAMQLQGVVRLGDACHQPWKKFKVSLRVHVVVKLQLCASSPPPKSTKIGMRSGCVRIPSTEKEKKILNHLYLLLRPKLG